MFGSHRMKPERGEERRPTSFFKFCWEGYDYCFFEQVETWLEDFFCFETFFMALRGIGGSRWDFQLWFKYEYLSVSHSPLNWRTSNALYFYCKCDIAWISARKRLFILNNIVDGPLSLIERPQIYFVPWCESDSFINSYPYL